MKIIKTSFNGTCNLKGEMQSLCPETGQTDYYQFEITYQPQKEIIEIYSLKKYLKRYESLQMYQEEITNDLYITLTETLNCHVKVIVKDESPGIQLTTEI